jgi:hypothetical protein
MCREDASEKNCMDAGFLNSGGWAGRSVFCGRQTYIKLPQTETAVREIRQLRSVKIIQTAM